MKFTYLLLFLCFACKKNVEEQGHVNKKDTIKKVVVQTINKDHQDILKNIDVQSVKSQIDGVTTSFIPKSKSKFFPDKKKNQYYAAYNLIKKDKDLTSDLIGRMIVYDSINPRIYEKATDEFIEITLIEKGIVLYDKFEVGMSKEKLLNILNKNYSEQGNTIAVNENKFKAFFQIKNNIVTKIKVGTYRDGINVEDMLEEFNRAIN